VFHCVLGRALKVPRPPPICPHPWIVVKVRVRVRVRIRSTTLGS
jgi:hypothetical protein